MSFLPIPQHLIPDDLITLVLDSVSSHHSRRAYRKALEDFLLWCSDAGVRAFNKASVQKYKAELERLGFAPSTISQRLSAIRKLATEAADNALLAPEIAAGITRVKGPRREGVRIGKWLTHEQADNLMSLPIGSRTKGLRDCAILAVMLGCGLRRGEVADLCFESVRHVEGRWILADIIGKNKRVRTVPMPDWAKESLDRWADSAGISTGHIFRSLTRAGKLAGHSITAQGIFDIVKSYAAIGGLDLAPHDLRRSHAKLAYKGGAALEQIQLCLGHASLITTQLYLGLQLDLKDAPCDHLGLRSERARRANDE
jgi:integrase/recombinase XerD